MAERLKYYDPVLEKTIDDNQQQSTEDNNNLQAYAQQIEEQKWLQNLRHLIKQYQQDYLQATTSSTTQLDTQQHQQQQQQYNSLTQDPNYNYQQQQIDQQFMEINKQFSELNLQYQQQQTTTNTTTEANVESSQQQPLFYNPEMQQQLGESQQQQQQQVETYNQQQQHQSLPTELPTTNAKDLQSHQPGAEDAYHTQSQYLQTDVPQQTTSYGNTNYYDPMQQSLQYNALDGNAATNEQPASYDYWAQQQQQQQLTEEVGF